ncbi:hypothetical protein ACFFVB_06035 [Formosa undariae]|uniref:Uncharacterized protein n=1 Tax=Formosa undariae TaxID=1325436 RepID=A0ABV5EZM0_9FLAO
MKEKRILYFLFFACVLTQSFVLSDSIQKLDTILTSANSQLNTYCTSPIYSKEHGLGKATSAYFRDTTGIKNGVNLDLKSKKSCHSHIKKQQDGITKIT